MSNGAAPRRRWRYRGPDPRTVAFAMVVLLFAGALFAVSDGLSRIGAQSLLARAIQRELHTPRRPIVHLHGAFFLPQVIGGSYGHVEINIASLRQGPLRIAELRADLRHVHLPFHDVLTRDARRILVDDTTELATLRYADLNRYLAATGTPLQLHAAGHGHVRFTGTTSVLGRSISASADARVWARGSTLYLSPSQFDSGLAGLDTATRLLLDQRFTVVIPLQRLPFGQTITDVRASGDHLLVQARGSDVVLSA